MHDKHAPDTNINTPINLSYKPFSTIEILDTSVSLIRSAPAFYWGMALLSAGPLLTLLLVLEYLAGARRLFTTSYEYDYFVIIAAFLVPLLLGWRGVCHGAMIRGGLEHLKRAQRSERSKRLAPLSIVAMLKESASSWLSIQVVALLRVALVWMGPLAMLILVSAIDPTMDPTLRSLVVLLVGIILIPVAMTCSGMTWIMLPRALMEGVVAGRLTSFIKSATLSFLLGFLFALLVLNLTLAVSLVLYLADAFFGVDVSYWNRFFSFDHRLFVFLLLGVSMWLMEPIGSVASALLWVDDRVKRDAVDLMDRLNALKASGRRRSPGKAPDRNPSKRGDRQTISQSVILVFALSVGVLAGTALPAHAQDDEPFEEEITEVDTTETTGLTSEHIQQARDIFEPNNTSTWRDLSDLKGYIGDRQVDPAMGEDQAWWDQLSKAVNEADTSWGDERERHLKRIEVLLSVRLDNPTGPTQEASEIRDSEQLRGMLDDILNQDEYIDLAAQPVERSNPQGLLAERESPFGKDWRKKNGCDGEPEHSRGGDSDAASNMNVPTEFFKLGAIVLAMLVLAMLVWFLIQRFSEANNRNEAQEGLLANSIKLDIDKQVAGQEDALAFTPEDWKQRAMRLASEGDFRTAIRSLYLALLVRLHQQGSILYNTASTNWEYEQQLRRSNGRVASVGVDAFTGLTQVFDRVWYGERPGTREQFDRCMAWTEQVLGASEKSHEEGV